MDLEKFQFKCDICEKSFFNEQILILHTRSNHNPNINTKNRCNLCENTFSCQGSLKTHVEMIHTEKKVFECEIFECEICDATFPHQRDLKHHKNGSHGDKKSFKCNLCEKEFAFQCTGSGAQIKST